MNYELLKKETECSMWNKIYKRGQMSQNVDV